MTSSNNGGSYTMEDAELDYDDDRIPRVCEQVTYYLNKEYKVFKWGWRELDSDHYEFYLKPIDCPLLTDEALNEIAIPADDIIEEKLNELSYDEFTFKMMGVNNGCDPGVILVLIMLNDDDDETPPPEPPEPPAAVKVQPEPQPEPQPASIGGVHQ